MNRTFLLIPLAASLLGSCALEANTTRTDWRVREIQHGQASWYGIRCNGGTRTASGRKLCNHASTAAHKTLPMGTRVRVTNLDNGLSEIVTITDRGPYTRGRIIDVTEGVAKRIGFFKRGVVKVKVEVLEDHDTGADKA